MMPKARTLLTTAILLVGHGSLADAGNATEPTPGAQPEPSTPRGGPVDIEALIDAMTLDEKVGQMTLAERGSATPDDVRDFSLGAILSGGGSAPASNTPTGWANMHDAYQTAALDTRLGVPILYGIDAVHGHSNVVGATIFPHNIGLGATRDPVLVEEIGRITAKEVAATGLEWTFAPCVAVVRDERWGRTYEGFGEHPELQTLLAGAYVRGLQGDTMSGERIIAGAKHFVGDGGTSNGVDRGNTVMDEATLRSLHMPGFIEAINQGVGNVMPSYSSWNGVKMHEHQYLLTDVLKNELGFDGFIVSDWQAVYELSGGSYYNQLVRMINAGVDLTMEPTNWRDHIATLKAAVNNGDVSMDRIDDAVRRLLRIKARAGVFAEPFADRSLVNGGSLGSVVHRGVAREAVRKSLVLLENNGVLPIAKSSSVFVAGKNADNMGYQCGGWTISWQGGSGDTTPGTTILEGIQAAVAGQGGSVTFSEDGSGSDGHDVAIVVIGETPYAEGFGDDADLALDPADLAALDRVGDIPTVVVLVSGRPLMVTDRIGRWDAFVAAWLPGTEGNGVSDVLFGDADFTGKLPHSWPVNIAQVPINVGDANYDPLFPYGYGLGYASLPPSVTVTSPPDDASVPAGTIVIEADATDANGTIARVDFFAGEEFLGTDTSAPFSFAWDAALVGASTITVRAYDNDGLISSDAIDVFVGGGTQSPYRGQPAEIPGLIDAEDFDNGGEGVAYHDLTPGNTGGAYRFTDVDIEPSTENGFNIGWIDQGEWLEYTVDVRTPGNYRLDARVASDAAGGAFRIEQAGTELTGRVDVPNTGGWQDWITVTTDLDLQAGEQTIRLAILDSFGGFNINTLTFTPTCTADINADGSLTGADFNAWLAAFSAQDPVADQNKDGAFTGADFNAFLANFAAGCG